MGRQERNMAGCWFSRCIYINFKFVAAKTWEEIGFMPSHEIERGITKLALVWELFVAFQL